MSLSDQIPVGSPFHAKSTGLEVLEGFDLQGTTAVVTGGYSGIGVETTRALAAKGATVIVPVRSPDKAAQTLADIDDVQTLPLDLGSLASVRACAEQLRERLPKLDLLINNAAVMACPLARLAPGWESQFGVNHMGHFALTQALMPLLTATPGARVVALSSTGHKLTDIRWEDPHFEAQPYDKWQAYGQAKTANALFANALSRRLRPSGGLAFSVHPGGIMTPLQRHLPQEEMVALGWLKPDGSPSELAQAHFKTPAQGCSTTLWAATSPLLADKPGVYCADCEVAAPTELGTEGARFYGVNPHAADDEGAERLWAMSERLLAAAS